MIRVYISSPSPMVRAGLEALLRSASNLETIGNGEEADVILADWDHRGEDLLQDLLELGPSAIVLLADDAQPGWIVEVLRAGVKGVLPRDATPAQILAAVEAAAAGLVVLQAEDVDEVLATPRPARQVEPLSPREMEVLGMLAEGQSNKSIAHRMSISEHTVKFHVNSIMTKLNAGSRTEAVTLGIRQGLILL